MIAQAGFISPGKHGNGMKEVYLVEVHAAPTDLAVKLADADWIYNKWGLRKTGLLGPGETIMIPDEIGQKLHDRATRGETLSGEKQDPLRRRYAHHDQIEMAQLVEAEIPD